MGKMGVNVKGKVGMMLEGIDGEMMVVYDMVRGVKGKVFVMKGEVKMEEGGGIEKGMEDGEEMRVLG